MPALAHAEGPSQAGEPNEPPGANLSSESHV
jgi:hypothetical protein